MTDMKTYAFGPRDGGRPRKVVLMLHGLGSNGQDLMGLAPFLAQDLPGDVLFLSPDAHQPCDMAPPGYGGYQWFSLKSFEPDFMLAGARAAEPDVNDYIDAILEQTGLSDSDLVLLGFSQGTMMSLFAAARRKKPVAGVIGYSGALLGPDLIKDSAMQRFPVLLVHGSNDDVVPVSAYHTAHAALEEAGYAVEGMVVDGLAHSIDEAGIACGAAFLKRVLA